MNAAIQAENAVRELLHQAALWRIAGLLFRRPSAEHSRALEILARETDDAEFIDAARSAARTSEGLFHAWLGHGGPLQPREVSYRPVADPGRLLAEIGAYHEAFAYRSGTEDPADHVAVAADFVAYLLLKEAFAASAAREADANTTREARERFVDEHLRPMARGMSRRLSNVAEDVNTAHFAAAVSLLARLAGADHALDRAEEAALDLPFTLPGLDDDTLDCGALGEDGSAGCANPCLWNIEKSP